MSNHDMRQQPSSKLAWLVIFTASLFFFYEFIQMNLFNAINGQLRSAFKLDAIQLGQLFAMYFYANALFLIPAGNLLDRFSTRKLLLSAILVCTIGTLIFALASTYTMAAVGRFMEGAGASFCFLSCIRIASRWFAPPKMAFVTGVVVTMAMLGGLVAQTPFTLLINHLPDAAVSQAGGALNPVHVGFWTNWRYGLFINSALGLIIFIATYFIVEDRPRNALAAAKSDQEQLKKLGLWRAMKLAALNPQNWLGGLYTSLMNLPVFVLGGLWGILYLQNVYQLTDTQASYVTTLFFVGVIFGSLAFGWFSDYIERRVMPMILGAIASLIVVLLLMYVPHLGLTSLLMLFFLIGFVTSSQVLTYPTIAELNPVYLTSTAVSIDSVCIMSSGFIVPPLFGWLMEHSVRQSGLQHAVKGGTVYSAQDFHQGMLIIPIAFIAALIVAFFIRETYCRLQVK